MAERLNNVKLDLSSSYLTVLCWYLPITTLVKCAKKKTHLYVPSQWINPFRKLWLAGNCSLWYFLGTWWKLSLSFTTAAKESPESRMFMPFLHPTKTGLILVKIHSYAICRARTVSSSADVYRYEIWVNMIIFQPCFKLAKLLWRLTVFLGLVTNKQAPVVQIVDNVILWIM